MNARAIAGSRLRVDKWLWAARFYKTRSLAAEAIDAGHVKVNDERVKPAHSIVVGSSVIVRKQGVSWNVVVLALDHKRGSAADAALLYREDAESIAAREEASRARAAAAAGAPVSVGRPTKRDRRKLRELLGG